MHLRAALALALLALASVPPAAASDPVVLPPPGEVWTVFTTVRATVDGNYAVVEVIADIGNEGPDPEFPFQVRVPDDAFVTGLTIVRDGTTHVARVADREEAREEYETWKGQQQTGALVEKTRRSDVYAYLVNVANFTSVRATLTYERHLVADRGVHNLSLEAPVSGFGRDLGARFEVHVRDASAAWGAPAADAQPHPDGGWLIARDVPPRQTDAPTPWTAYYTMDATGDAGALATAVRDGTGYFAHRFRAQPDATHMPLDLALVLDTSGSMSGLKIEQMRDAAAQVVRALGPEDRLHLVSFSVEAAAPWEGLRAMRSDARQEAASEVAALLPGGGTNIEAGLRAGFAALAGATATERASRLQALVILTDGQPTEGTKDGAALRRIAREANAVEANVYAIAFGRDADWPLVFALASEGRGSALQVPEGAGAEVDIERFVAALATPVLKDVRIEYGPGVEAHGATAPVLLAGSEMLVVGTFDPDLGVSGTVRATGPDGARVATFEGGDEAQGPTIPRLVAFHEIRRLQDLLDTQGHDDARLARLKTLALEHGFVTDHTSLVLTVPARAIEPGTWSRDGAAQGLATRSSAYDASNAPHGAPLHLTVPTTTPTRPPPEMRHQGAAGDDAARPTPSAEVPAPGLLAALAVGVAVAVAVGRRGR